MSLPEIVRSAAVRRAAATPTVHVDVEVPHEARVRADEVRLSQALDNLLDNAVRHGAPPFAVSAHVREDQAELRVTDAGSGVPAELVPRVFDRFATAGPTSGTGLGLYLVREIVRGHGGEVAYGDFVGQAPVAQTFSQCLVGAMREKFPGLPPRVTVFY